MNMHVRVQHLSRHYPISHGTAVKRAVDDVSFDFQEGERIGLIGRNGAGKTTLLQMLSGVIQPTSGSLEVSGKVTAIFTIGLGLREDLTGRENIYVEGEMLGRSREQTDGILEEIVAFSELGSFIDSPVRTYSTGMKARLAFSTIVHIEPEILIIDEALSVGDSKFAAKATAKMRELARKGRILIVVSHSMSAIEEMCNRCLWIENGRIRMDGPPAQVTRAYLDEVRRSDDEQLVTRFKAECRSESLADGWAVGELRWVGEVESQRTSVRTGAPTTLEVSITGRPDAEYGVELSIERLDGVPILLARSVEDGFLGRLGDDGAAAVEIDFGPMPLNWGIYRMRVLIRREGQVLATRTAPFEVVNERRQSGGRSILVYPAPLTVENAPMKGKR